MPSLEVMTPLGRTMLNELPSWAQNEPLYRAACHAFAKEHERLVAKAQELRDGLIPSRMVGIVLELWEVMVKLPRNPPGATTTERWDAVIARLRRVIEDPSGTTWIARVTEQIGAGWVYVEEAPNIINVTVPWQPATDRFIQAERVLLEEIPAAWELVLGFEGGFILDRSKLDKEQFHQD